MYIGNCSYVVFNDSNLNITIKLFVSFYQIINFLKPSIVFEIARSCVSLLRNNLINQIINLIYKIFLLKNGLL